MRNLRHLKFQLFRIYDAPLEYTAGVVPSPNCILGDHVLHLLEVEQDRAAYRVNVGDSS